jgi:resuscitation-promoting factor RpfA
VLRFWESRFPQVKPVKRAGGRRYYRPADMMLLGGIKRLLHDDGMTIRGVQKMLREEGVRHVSSFSQPIDAAFPIRDVTPEEEEEIIAPGPMAVDVEPEPTDNVVPLAAAAEEAGAMSPEPAEERDEPAAPEAEEAGETEPFLLVPAPGDRLDEPEPSPSEDMGALPPAPADEEAEVIPELSFLRRSPPAEPAPDAEPAREPDLFSSRRSAEPAPREAAPLPPRIPPTPGVPATDAADDDDSIPARPGLAARLLAGTVRVEHAAIAQAVADLHALRARL